MIISSHSGTKAILEKYDLRSRKSLGQNFLIDQHVLGKIIRAADIGPEDIVLEIGAGIGGLTQILAEYASKVIAVEIDKYLVAALKDIFLNYQNVQIVHGDILKLDLSKFDDFKDVEFVDFKDIEAIAEDIRVKNNDAGNAEDTRVENNDVGNAENAESTKNVKIVANLPYYVTTPIIMHLLENYRFKSITVMVQEEVAERMVSGPDNKKSYGALSLAVEYHARASITAYVPPNSFIPRPKVGSAVVHMDILQKPPVDADKPALFANIKSGFGKRRKTLVNCLHSSEIYNFTKEELGDILKSCGLSESVRAEELTLDDWSKLTFRLNSGGL